MRKNLLDDIPVTPKGKIDVETVQEGMNKTWKKKSEEVSQDEPVSTPSVEVSELTNWALEKLRGTKSVKCFEPLVYIGKRS